MAAQIDYPGQSEQIQGNAGVALTEGREQRGDDPGAEPFGHTEADLAAKLAVLVGQVLTRLERVAGHLFGMGQQLVASLGQMVAVRATLKQLCVELVLETPSAA